MVAIFDPENVTYVCSNNHGVGWFWSPNIEKALKFNSSGELLNFVAHQGAIRSEQRLSTGRWDQFRIARLSKKEIVERIEVL